MEKNDSKKKRKVVSDGGVEQEGNELEAEMKIFFALIDNIREARMLLMNGSNNVVVNAAGMDQNDGDGTSGKKKRKRLIEDEKEKERSKEMFSSAAVLKPALVLQRQDSREEAQFKVPTSQITEISRGEKGKSTECNLDLTLSL